MSQGIENPDLATHGQQVLVLQGGGALGAYQVGVYQAPTDSRQSCSRKT